MSGIIPRSSSDTGMIAPGAPFVTPDLLPTPLSFRFLFELWRGTKGGGPLYATSFPGVDPTGQSDSTAGLQAWLNAGCDLYLPSGRYLTGPLTLINKEHVKITGGGSNLQTASGVTCGTFLVLTTPDSWLLTLTGCQVTVRDITFIANGPLRSLTGAQGVLLNGATGNSLFERCSVIGFASGGLFDEGNSSAANDGNRYDGCYFLYNGNVQLLLSWSEDFMITDCQVGGDTAGPPTYGLQLANSSNGSVINTLFWSNGVGLVANSSNYLRIIGNRFEMSYQQGSAINGCSGLIYVGNWLNQNSLSSSGALDNAYFENVTDGTIVGNLSWNWGDSSTSHRYGLYFDAGCQSLQLGQNQGSGYTEGPTAVSYPPNALADSVHQSDVPFSSAVPLSSGSPYFVTSLPLSSGVWELAGNVGFSEPGTLSEIIAYLVAPGLTGPGNGATVALYTDFLTGGGDSNSIAVGPTIINLTAATEVSLEAQAVFTGSCSAYGYLQAKRIA